MRDALDEHAVGGVARNDDAGLEKRALAGVEMKLGLALLLVRAVARETVVRQDRTDVAVEAEGSRTRRRGRPLLRPRRDAHRAGSDGNDTRGRDRHASEATP